MNISGNGNILELIFAVAQHMNLLALVIISNSGAIRRTEHGITRTRVDRSCLSSNFSRLTYTF